VSIEADFAFLHLTRNRSAAEGEEQSIGSRSEGQGRVGSLLAGGVSLNGINPGRVGDGKA
jgi:hypothetical protein